MSWSPRCYIPSFVKIRLLVLEKIFEGFFTIYGRGGHLGNVTHMPRTNFCSPYPSRLQIKFGFDWASGFGEEDVWNCLRRRRTDDGRWINRFTIGSRQSLRLRWAKYSKKWAKLTYPGGSHQRPYHFNLVERKKTGKIKGLLRNMWLILLYIVQLVISDVCAKFQNTMSSSSWEIFDNNFQMHYIVVRDRKSKK